MRALNSLGRPLGRAPKEGRLGLSYGISQPRPGHDTETCRPEL